MIITKTGHYIVEKTITLRTGAFSVATFPKGMHITITQVDAVNRQVYGPALEDWQYFELPFMQSK